MQKISYKDFNNLITALEQRQPLTKGQQAVVSAAVQAQMRLDPGHTNTTEFVIEAVKAAYQFVNPHEPQRLFVEYVGACRQRSGPSRGQFRGQFTRFADDPPDDEEPYASGWLQDGWNIVFPESVLRAFFPEGEKPFDGNFHKLLLESKDLSKAYKQLARKYHPDLNSGKSKYFLRLKRAYDDLRDPQRRKRYEAGLKFEQAHKKQKTKAGDNDVVFRVPKTCGMVTVVGEHDEHGRLQVAEIMAWEDIVDGFGRMLTATWYSARTKSYKVTGEKPFTHEYKFAGGVEFNVEV